MLQGLDRLGAVLLDASLAAAAWLGAMALLMVACRQPARRRALAGAALVGALLVWPVAASGLMPRVDLGDLARLAAPPGSEGARVATPAELIGPWVLRGLAIAYLAGVAIGLGWLGLGWVAAGWLVARSAEPGPGPTAIYEAIPYRGRGDRPRLRVSARIGRPALVGLVRPTIVIPPRLARPEAAEALRLGLLHELAHAQRYDPWLGLVGSLAQAVWFVLPPAWWVRNQLRLDQEFLADYQAAVGFGPLKLYARSLLDLAAPKAGAGEAIEAGPLASDAEGRSSLFPRVAMLVRCPFPIESQPPTWWRNALPPVAAVGLLMASALSLGQPRDGSCHRPTTPVSQADDGRPSTYRVDDLWIAESHPGARVESLPYLLPIRLPDRFDLSCDLLADDEALARTRLAGQLLGSEAETLDPAEALGPIWHAVRLRRDDDGTLALWVDQRRLATDRDATPPGAWLSIEPAPRCPTRIRNLVMTWP